jgi:hypothetical protein
MLTSKRNGSAHQQTSGGCHDAHDHRLSCCCGTALRFKVSILFPVIGLAFLGAAGVGIGHGDRIASVALTTVLLGSALQIGYLAAIVTRALLASTPVAKANVPRIFAFASGQPHLSRFKSLDVQDHMEVVGSDGKHVGTVDQKESADQIILTKDDPKRRRPAASHSAQLLRGRQDPSQQTVEAPC